ncbi:BRCT domain-containing protein [Candidatus Williamhamiltonella defendens]|uniref:BRCT domain-containing protein n=1 Tax=Candidatus Williamhamiltonella defendens TaxID=138072 RepID=UPI002A4E1521|nr:BRCT domain-containing protein [Candidatus Hamiltonella defensa]
MKQKARLEVSRKASKEAGFLISYFVGTIINVCFRFFYYLYLYNNGSYWKYKSSDKKIKEREYEIEIKYKAGELNLERDYKEKNIKMEDITSEARIETRFDRFNYFRNRDKYFANLISIIDGIICDDCVNSKEILYLDTWLLNANEISDNFCFKSIRRKISEVLAYKFIDHTKLNEIKKDLIIIQKNLLELPYLHLNSIESGRHLFEGLCKGILSDKELNDSEIKYLQWFLSKNDNLKKNYPGKIIYNIVKDILQDSIVTEEEREFLRKTLISFTGCDIESGVVDGLATQLPIDIINKFNASGKTVCLTGEFIYGKRSVCEQEIIRQGANVIGNVTKKLDYLIAGTMSSKNWRYTSHGRKIEKAVHYRDEKAIPLKIINEEQWQDFSYSN